MMWSSSLSALVVGAALIPQIYAWGAVGHEIVATVAEMHLHPSVMPKLCGILQPPSSVAAKECHLASVAAWADRIRNQPKYRWTGPLHYVNAVDDYPSTTCAFPGPQGWQGRTHINVLNAIRNTTTVLQEFAPASGEPVPGYVQDALKFLIHFIGDMHQPLHLTGRNRGGNGDKVAFDGRSTNLHSVWDSLLISERIRTLPYNYTKPLPLPEVESHLQDTIYDPYIRRLVWEGLLGKWQDELETWLVCPESSSSSARLQSELASSSWIWQTVHSFLSWVVKGKGVDEDGLGVDDDKLCPYAWAKPINQLNCDLVYPKELDLAPFTRLSSGRASQEDDDCGCGGAHHDDEEWNPNDGFKRKSPYFELYTPEYAGTVKEQWVVEKLLTQAGVRLAGVLNWIFAELEEEEGKIQRSYLTL